MKTCNICKRRKSFAEFHVRRASIDGLAYTCRLCRNRESAAFRQAHPTRYREWYRKNREHKKQYFAAWRAQHAEQHRQSYRRWVRANPSRKNALIARRQATKLRATPTWADQTAIRAIYQEALRLTRETGIPHEVDHIVPLRSALVCGLHVPANLQILTRDANKKKSNHLDGTLQNSACIAFRRRAAA
jgi:5-methylcytosine-specific restriction endonuclease McrA